MSLLIGSIELGIIYSLLVLGIYISFRILDVPDLTADGSFTFGMAVMAMSVTAGHPYLGVLLSLAAGSLAGLVTALLQTQLKIQPILAGILTMTGLYSINLMVMQGTSNVALLDTPTVFHAFSSLLTHEVTRKVLYSAVIVLVVIALLELFFKTNCGLCIRAIGDNERMARASSMNVNMYKIIAFMISNALIGLSGGLIACDQGFADMNSGVGMLIVGLAAVIIGEAIVRKRGILFGLIGCLVGSIAYRIILAVAIKSDFFPAYAMKLISAVVVVLALALPAWQNYRANQKLRKGDAHAGTE